MSTNPALYDFLSRIKNHRISSMSLCAVPNSKVVEKCLSLLAKFGYITTYSISENGRHFNVMINPGVDNAGAISGLTIFSKPGKRVYCSADELKSKSKLNPFATFIVSTSHGIMTVKDAVKDNIGGELLFAIF